MDDTRGHRCIIEPFKIKVVEPLNMRSRAEREESLRRAVTTCSCCHRRR